MRLRYLHLPDYGVLKDLRVDFRHETVLVRRGSIQFVVGLNGTGKSSLLRAVYETFRSLEEEDVPPFPVAMVWEIEVEGKRNLVVFKHLDRGRSSAEFTVVPPESPIMEVMVDRGDDFDWPGIVDAFDGEVSPTGASNVIRVRGDQFRGNQLVSQHLPDPLLAYTSGDLAAWRKLREAELQGEDLAALLTEGRDSEQDRPRGWDITRELSNVDSPLEESQRRALRDALEPSERDADAKCLLLEPLDLKLSAIAVGLTVAADELREHPTETQLSAWRESLRAQVMQQQRGKRPEDKDARTLLNEIDWLRPTHLCLNYRPSNARINAEWHAQWLSLISLADEVIRQPLGRMQMVIELGTGTRQIGPEIEGAYGGRDIPVEVREVIERVDASTSGAEAVVRALSTSKAIDDSMTSSRRLGEVFRTLRSWRVAGLIEDATVTVKRVTPVLAHDGEPDDVVLMWDDFSDGERVLLGRMALLLLLRGRDGGMLLLDEPETHFNDSWKREIIDIVDDNLLKTSAVQVMVATHTSIALTDAFANEIVRLVRQEGRSELKPITVPTFGAEPGRLMLHVFDMPASIGSRAEQALRERLAREWTGGDRRELERIVSTIGGGWPRARLQQILDDLTDASPSP